MGAWPTCSRATDIPKWKRGQDVLLDVTKRGMANAFTTDRGHSKQRGSKVQNNQIQNGNENGYRQRQDSRPATKDRAGLQQTADSLKEADTAEASITPVMTILELKAQKGRGHRPCPGGWAVDVSEGAWTKKFRGAKSKSKDRRIKPNDSPSVRCGEKQKKIKTTQKRVHNHP